MAGNKGRMGGWAFSIFHACDPYILEPGFFCKPKHVIPSSCEMCIKVSHHDDGFSCRMRVDIRRQLGYVPLPSCGRIFIVPSRRVDIVNIDTDVFGNFNTGIGKALGGETIRTIAVLPGNAFGFPDGGT